MHPDIYKLGLYSLLMIITSTLSAQTHPYQAKTFKASDGVELGYNIYRPLKIAQPLPILLFLHGSGERGDDNQAQLKNVAMKFVDESFQTHYPCIVVVPQCPADDYWATVDRTDGIWTANASDSPRPAMARVIGLMQELMQDSMVDLSRVYISGLSMGGFGTFDLLSRHPDWFAAAVPICGGADIKLVDQYAHIPMWIFHGAIDPVVPVDLSRSVYKKLLSLEAPVTYTEFGDGDHLVWDRAYDGNTLVKWLFIQQKK